MNIVLVRVSNMLYELWSLKGIDQPGRTGSYFATILVKVSNEYWLKPSVDIFPVLNYFLLP
jgi:hypothetical protein